LISVIQGIRKKVRTITITSVAIITKKITKKKYWVYPAHRETKQHATDSK